MLARSKLVNECIYMYVHPNCAVVVFFSWLSFQQQGFCDLYVTKHTVYAKVIVTRGGQGNILICVRQGCPWRATSPKET